MIGSVRLGMFHPPDPVDCTSATFTNRRVAIVGIKLLQLRRVGAKQFLNMDWGVLAWMTDELHIRNLCRYS